MNTEHKMRLAGLLFSETSMTKDQTKQFLALADDLDLTVDKISRWEERERTLEHRPVDYINDNLETSW